MLDQPQIVRPRFQRTAIIRITIPWAEIRSVMDPTITELLAAVTAQASVPLTPFSRIIRR